MNRRQRTIEGKLWFAKPAAPLRQVPVIEDRLLSRRHHIGVRPTWPHWLALAGTRVLFARKSHAARHFARNRLICRQ
jgi:hypothetical protein